MSAISRIVSVARHFAELVCACVVAGIIGSYVDAFEKANAWPEKRLTEIEVIAGTSMLPSLDTALPLRSQLASLARGPPSPPAGSLPSVYLSAFSNTTTAAVG